MPAYHDNQQVIQVSVTRALVKCHLTGRAKPGHKVDKGGHWSSGLHPPKDWTCNVVAWCHLLGNPLDATQVKRHHSISLPTICLLRRSWNTDLEKFHLHANLRSTVNYLIMRVQFSNLLTFWDLKLLWWQYCTRAKNYQSLRTTKDESHLYKMKSKTMKAKDNALYHKIDCQSNCLKERSRQK